MSIWQQIKRWWLRPVVVEMMLVEIPVGSVWCDRYGETSGDGFRWHTYEVVEIVGNHIRIRDTEESITPIDLLDRALFLRMLKRVDQAVSNPSNSPTASRESHG